MVFGVCLTVPGLSACLYPSLSICSVIMVLWTVEYCESVCIDPAGLQTCIYGTVGVED